MSLEVANTVLAALTLAVIAATAMAALVQLRHLRASNQLQGLITILRVWEDPSFQHYMDFVRNELPSKVEDPSFLASLDGPGADRKVHPELHVCDMWEQIGSFVKYGLIEERSFMDVACQQVYDTWMQVSPVVDRMRLRRGPSLYENFEYLAARGLAWIRRYPDGSYPAGTPRIATMLEKADP